MKTEAEARKCWCPYAFPAISISYAGSNRNTGYEENTRCIASECMAWRAVAQWRIRSDKPWVEGEPIEPRASNNETRTVGYCGIAGKP